MSFDYEGPKVVPLNRAAMVRMYMKKLEQQMARPGVRSITFIIEREDGVNIQTSHADEHEIATLLEKTAHTMKGW